MPYYLWTGNYTREAMQAMVANPSDREAVARKVVEAAGGKLHHMFFALGSADAVILTDSRTTSASPRSRWRRVRRGRGP